MFELTTLAGLFKSKAFRVVTGVLVSALALWAVHSVSYSTGFANGRTHEQGYQAITKLDAIKTQVEEEHKAQVELKVRDVAVEQKLQANLTDALARNRQLERLLNAQAPEGDDCRITVGTVRLLNEAKRAGNQSDSSSLSDPSLLAAYQEQTPSTVSCRALSLDSIAVYAQYNELALRHDTLVDWIDRELIQKQLSKKD